MRLVGSDKEPEKRKGIVKRKAKPEGKYYQRAKRKMKLSSTFTIQHFKSILTVMTQLSKAVK